MKILLVNANDLDGGAARAAYRLHKGLQKCGISSQMLVQKKQDDDSTILGSQSRLAKTIAMFKPTLNELPLKIYPQLKTEIFSPQWLPDNLVDRVDEIAPDLINLHWLNFGFIKIETLAKISRPLIWTFHDMWAFTGGCHYTDGCDRYQQSCGSCPQLGSSWEKDLSRQIWQRKAKIWKQLNLTIVTPSKWLAQCTRESSLCQNFQVEIIPNGIDTNRYQPINKLLARKLLGLPLEKKILLFGAIKASSTSRKGFHLLLPALQQLRRLERQDEIELVVFGSSQPQNPLDCGFPVHYFGRLHDDISLALLYAAADVFIAPSLQDNLPNTVMESLACGTPCVGFKVGGMPDLIEHQKNGYLAEPFVIEDLAKGINWILANRERYLKLSVYARQKIEREFNLELQVNRYLSLYRELIINSEIKLS
jgi:glycosyltransferase involved in cell wall biosynthesis